MTMKKWEDIVKDKLTESDDVLPESSFGKFRVRRDAVVSAPVQKRVPLAWAVVPVVAAVLATVLILSRPSVNDSGSQIIQHPSSTVSIGPDSITVGGQDQTERLIDKIIAPYVIARVPARQTQGVESVVLKSVEEKITTNPEEESVTIGTEVITTTDTTKEIIPEKHFITTRSPFIPEKKDVKTVSIKVVPATGLIAGGSVVAAVSSHILSTGIKDKASKTDTPQGGIVASEYPQEDGRDEDIVHYFPLKVGLSTRIPISERLFLTTGFDYSCYKSSLVHPLSGKINQYAHYIGIPMRFDWMLASDRWLDVYLGGGLEEDFCLGAALGGNRISKDGFITSILGTGGIQFKLTKRVGLYFEPVLSWTLTPQNPVLQTYRTDNPLMFSAASGVRVTL